MRIEAVLALFSDMEATELTGWVERGWVQPESGGEGGWVFQEVDVARVRLIHDLRRDLDVAEEALPLVLSLLDQVYDLRAALRSVIRAVGSQPRDMQEAVLNELLASGAVASVSATRSLDTERGM
jgi:chaperone modulatory protein CbpM